jgi:Uma2 family endonuclease
MPTLLAPLPVTLQQQVPRRKLWTRDQLAPLEAAGFFHGERLELIEGELISKMGKNRPHVIAVTSMFLWLIECFGKSFVEAEAPIDVRPEDNSTSEPEPDHIVLNRDRSTFAHNPQPADILLLVEVSDSTLAYDLTVKGGLYARAGISEYWVFDLNGRCLIVHRQPVSGQYSSVVSYSEQEAIAPLASPASPFCAALVLPPVS